MSDEWKPFDGGYRREIDGVTWGVKFIGGTPPDNAHWEAFSGDGRGWTVANCSALEAFAFADAEIAALSEAEAECAEAMAEYQAIHDEQRAKMAAIRDEFADRIKEIDIRAGKAAAAVIRQRARAKSLERTNHETR